MLQTPCELWRVLWCCPVRLGRAAWLSVGLVGHMFLFRYVGVGFPPSTAVLSALASACVAWWAPPLAGPLWTAVLVHWTGVHVLDHVPPFGFGRGGGWVFRPGSVRCAWGALTR